MGRRALISFLICLFCHPAFAIRPKVKINFDFGDIRFVSVPKVHCGKSTKAVGCAHPNFKYRINFNCDDKKIILKYLDNPYIAVDKKYKDEEYVFDQILKHEMTHIQLYRGSYKKGLQKIAAELLTIYDDMDGKSSCGQIRNILIEKWKILTDQLYSEANEQQNLIDGEENYAYQDHQVYEKVNRKLQRELEQQLQIQQEKERRLQQLAQNKQENMAKEKQIEQQKREENVRETSSDDWLVQERERKKRYEDEKRRAAEKVYASLKNRSEFFKNKVNVSNQLVESEKKEPEFLEKEEQQQFLQQLVQVKQENLTEEKQIEQQKEMEKVRETSSDDLLVKEEERKKQAAERIYASLKKEPEFLEKEEKASDHLIQSKKEESDITIIGTDNNVDYTVIPQGNPKFDINHPVLGLRHFLNDFIIVASEVEIFVPYANYLEKVRFWINKMFDKFGVQDE